MPIAVVLFDLGGVLADFVGAAGLASDWIRRFERGACTPEAFAAGVVAEWQLPVTADEFLDMFAEWVIAPYEGAEDLVREVAASVPVGCLSNMNRTHWERTVSHWPLSGMLRFRFLSFQIGLVKPDTDMFRHVLRELAVEPSTVLFLDDSPTNVAEATRIGLRAVQARGVDGARQALQDAGVIVAGDDE